MTDTDTDAGPTRFASTPWSYTVLDDLDEHHPGWAEAAVWDCIGDLVCTVTTQMNSDGSVEQAEDRARLIAAAGTAAHELDDEYDPVAAVEALPQLLKTLEALDETMEAPDMAEGTLTPMGMHDYIKDALQKARRDDE